jgi:hypothetical protein
MEENAVGYKPNSGEDLSGEGSDAPTGGGFIVRM